MRQVVAFAQRVEWVHFVVVRVDPRRECMRVNFATPAPSWSPESGTRAIRSLQFFSVGCRALLFMVSRLCCCTGRGVNFASNFIHLWTRIQPNLRFRRPHPCATANSLLLIALSFLAPPLPMPCTFAEKMGLARAHVRDSFSTSAYRSAPAPKTKTWPRLSTSWRDCTSRPGARLAVSTRRLVSPCAAFVFVLPVLSVQESLR